MLKRYSNYNKYSNKNFGRKKQHQQQELASNLSMEFSFFMGNRYKNAFSHFLQTKNFFGHIFNGNLYPSVEITLVFILIYEGEFGSNTNVMERKYFCRFFFQFYFKLLLYCKYKNKKIHHNFMFLEYYILNIVRSSFWLKGFHQIQNVL